MQTALRIRRQTQSPKQSAEWENAYYLTSLSEDAKTPEQWLQTIRNHWAGVEIRNHWRKDACLFEDKTRSRNPNLVGALILLRNVVLHFYEQHAQTYSSLPAFVESVAAKSSFALSLVLRPR